VVDGANGTRRQGSALVALGGLLGERSTHGEQQARLGTRVLVDKVVWRLMPRKQEPKEEHLRALVFEVVGKDAAAVVLVQQLGHLGEAEEEADALGRGRTHEAVRNGGQTIFD